MDWMTIWKIVLVVSLALFAVLTIITTVLGAGDVRRLFQRLEDERRDQK
jgi:sensor domain CHASE-containing protein